MLQLDSIEEFTADGTPVTLLACIGTLMPHDSRRLHDQLGVCLRYGRRHVVLDVTEVTYADPAAAVVLARTRNDASSAACTFSIITPQRDAILGLDLDGMNRLIRVHQDLTAALASLRPSDHDAD